MKKWLAGILALALCVSLTACGSSPVAKSPETTEGEVLYGSAMESEETTPEPAPEIKYYEECEVLPVVSTVIAVKQTGYASHNINGVITKQEYQYTPNWGEDIEKLLETYIAVLNDVGLTATVDAGVWSVLED